jgi:hypothetical protein
MSDIFKEQLVKKDHTPKDTLKKAFIFSIGSLASLLSLLIFGAGGGMLMIFVILIIIFVLINRMNIEYEYIFTNGSLDIDCIYNKSSRKRVFSADLSEFEIMAHISDKAHLSEYDSLKTKDYSSGQILGNTYAFVINAQGRRVKIIIEPNEEILNSMYVYLTPKKCFRKKQSV